MASPVGISKFGSLGVSTPHLVTLLFGSFLVYTVAIFVVTPHSFVTLHHHELVHPRLGRDFPHHLYLERSHELIHHNYNPTHTTYIPHKYISRAKWAMYPAQLVYLYPVQNHFPHQISNVSRAISLYPAQSVYILSLVGLVCISHPKSFPAQLVYILHNQFIFRV